MAGEAGMGAQAQQAPFGVSPASGPTPNRGYEAAAQQKLGGVVQQLTLVLPLVGATSDLGQAVMKAINSLAKFVPPGAVTPAGERNNIEEMMTRHAQNTQLSNEMRQARQSPAGQQPRVAAMPQQAGAA